MSHLTAQPAKTVLRAALEGLGATLRAHPHFIALTTTLYSVLFMFFQQTLLIDGLTYTPSGPFELHLLPGRWVEVTTTPPTPSMPFPLWGTPYLSIATNYFDLAITPLSMLITLSESFLVATVIAIYLDIYASVGQSFAQRPALGLAQTLTLTTIFIACTCEFFEGILAAVEPAAAIISTAIPGLLAALDEEFVVFSLIILAVSAVVLSARTKGVDATERFPKEYLWFTLYTAPLTLFNLLEGAHEGAASALWATATAAGLSTVAAIVTRNRQLLVVPAPILAYFAVSGEELFGQAGFKTIALAVSATLGVALGIGSKPRKGTVAALIFAAAATAPIDPYLTLAPLLMLASSLVDKKPTLKHYLVLQAASWAPTMLGPIAVAYRPVPPIPLLSLQSQLAFYLYLWLIATPLSWYLGVKAIFALMEKAKVVAVERVRRKAKWELDEGALFAGVGVLAMASQAAFFYASPQAFLASSYTDQARTLAITATSLAVFLIGVALLLAGLRRIVLEAKAGWLRPVSIILADRSKAKVYWATLAVYLVLSLFAVGTFAWGSEAPPGIPLPSVGVFPSGPLLYAPSATVYLTKGFGIVLVPEHILVAAITSVLVATSYKALALVSARPGARRAGLIGGATAVALSCPTCTASSIYGLLGLNSAAAGIGVIATPFAGTAILLATWAALAATVVYASRKLEPSPKPPLKPKL